MALKHIVLGVLCDREAHGYAVAQAVSAACVGARPIEFSRIYALLGELERAGLVASGLVLVPGGRRLTPREAGHDGRSRRVYGSTARGAAEYRRWLGAPLRASEVLRRPLLMRVALGVLRGSAASVPSWQRELRRCEAELRRLAAAPTPKRRVHPDALAAATHTAATNADATNADPTHADATHADALVRIRTLARERARLHLEVEIEMLRALLAAEGHAAVAPRVGVRTSMNFSAAGEK